MNKGTLPDKSQGFPFSRPQANPLPRPRGRGGQGMWGVCQGMGVDVGVSGCGCQGMGLDIRVS